MLTVRRCTEESRAAEFSRREEQTPVGVCALGIPSR